MAAAKNSRRGNYVVLTALSIMTFVGFGALAVDVSWIRLAQRQSQDVADAAAQSALLVLRRTGDQAAARVAAEEVVALNTVGAGHATLASLEFGVWDEDAATFTVDPTSPNAVRARVERTGGNQLGLVLAPAVGWAEVPVVAQSTAAARRLEAVLVMDITNSWDHYPNFHNARDAAVSFLDTVYTTASPDDLVGMVVFSGRYAWEYTPFTPIVDTMAAGGVRSVWSTLETAAKAGHRNNGHNKHCNVFGDNGYHLGWRNRFDLSPCFTDTPREYADEYGTDHTTGLTMAGTMFSELPDIGSYRAMIVLTDGYPNGTGPGNQRTTAGYTETRWREYRGPTRTVADIKTESVAMTADLYNDEEVNTWVVSFVAHDVFMEDMVQGDGAYYNVNTSAALIPIFEDIAESLPVVTVE